MTDEECEFCEETIQGHKPMAEIYKEIDGLSCIRLACEICAEQKINQEGWEVA